MLSRTVSAAGSVAGRRALHLATRPLQQVAAGAASSADKSASAVNPEDPIIAPSEVPGREYKNEYYQKRGYKLAEKGWTEWSDLPAPYKYLGVKVDPAHVENSGFLWKAMSDWKLAVPLSLILAMPLYMTGNFPGFDERLELSMLTILAGTVIVKEVAPMATNMIKGGTEARVKALYDAEGKLNSELQSTITAYLNGQAIPDTMRTVHSAERALRALEAKATTLKAATAQRDSVVAELDYLVSLRGMVAGAQEGEILKAARLSVESALEKDAALQAKSVEAAIKALKEGSTQASDDVIEPAFVAAVAKATKDMASKPATNPFTQASQVEIFNKRFGFGDGGVKTLPGGAKRHTPLAFLKK